jgi:DNA-directed RNA polymerase subunit RPC12/RpoP
MLLSEIDTIENGKITTKDSALFECPNCKSTFARDFIRNKMKKWGKDKQFFYNTKHCPNCDGRILMKDQNKDALRKRIEQLRQYANQCGITGDLEEKRAALKEIANLEAEFKSLTENLPIKDTLNPTTAESIKNMPDEQIRHHIIEEVNREGNGAPVLEDGSLTDKVIAFFKTHPNPPDAAVHAFAQQLNIAPDIIETEIYKLVTKYVQLTKDGKEDYEYVERYKGFDIYKEKDGNEYLIQKKWN